MLSKKILSDVLPHIRFPLVTSTQLAAKIVPLNLLPSDVVLTLFSYVAQNEAGTKPELPTALQVYSAVPRKPPGPKPLEFINKAGAPVTLGTRGEGRGRFYCNRRLGTNVIPGSDGNCGPNDGPQCPDCAEFIPVNRSGTQVKPGSNYRWYCGKSIVININKKQSLKSRRSPSSTNCGPTTGPQCEDCRAFQRATPKFQQTSRRIHRK